MFVTHKWFCSHFTSVTNLISRKRTQLLVDHSRTIEARNGWESERERGRD